MPSYDALRTRFPQLRPMFSARQAAEYIGVCPATLCHWRKRGVGPPWIRIGPHDRGLIRYPVAEFQAWLAEREAGSGSKTKRDDPLGQHQEWDVLFSERDATDDG